MSDRHADLANLDHLVHEPARLVILALLYPAESADFLYLVRQSGLTKRNLSFHLSKLEQACYVEATKSVYGKRPQTTLRLTERGRTAYRHYRAQMKRAVDRLPA